MSLRVGSRLIGSVVGVIIVLTAGFPPDTAAITLVVSVGVLSSIVCALALRKSLIRAGIDRDLMDYELYLTPLYSVLAAVGVHGLVTSIMPKVAAWGASDRSLHAIELLLSAVLYTGVALILLRFSYFEKLCILLRTTPVAVRTPLMRVLAIRDSDIERKPDIKP